MHAKHLFVFGIVKTSKLEFLSPRNSRICRATNSEYFSQALLLKTRIRIASHLIYMRLLPFVTITQLNEPFSSLTDTHLYDDDSRQFITSTYHRLNDHPAYSQFPTITTQNLLFHQNFRPATSTQVYC